MSAPVSNQTKRKLPTTVQMINEALLQSDQRKGTTLRSIYTYIEEKYSLDLSKRRVNFAKKHLVALMESKELTNLTATGLRGHFKLTNKKSFERSVNVRSKRKKKQLPAVSATALQDPLPPSQVYELEERIPAPGKRKKHLNVLPPPQLPTLRKRPPAPIPTPTQNEAITLEECIPPPSSQVYEYTEEVPVIRRKPGKSKNLNVLKNRILQRNFQRELDSPMVPIRASTPIERLRFPLAPRKSKSASRSPTVADVEMTPRTSLSDKRKRLRRIQNTPDLLHDLSSS
uniref:H15 domain-containing protein n=1 Tax=Stomoxys calcitrans TaxID=35570 RepID=A0A1I8PX02_STOCA